MSSWALKEAFVRLINPQKIIFWQNCFDLLSGLYNGVARTLKKLWYPKSETTVSRNDSLQLCPFPK